MEPSKKRSNWRTVLVLTLILIYVLGVLAYVSGVITSLSALSHAWETPTILITSFIGLTIAVIVALVRLSKENR